MACKHGQYLGGIRTPEDLRLRCLADDDTGCWLWRGGRGGYPCVTFVLDGVRMKTSGRRAALMLAGVKIPKGYRAISKAECKSLHCVNPDHTKAGTVKQIGARLSREGKFNTPERRVQLARANEQRSKTTRQQRIDIMLSVEPASAIADRLGLSVGRVRAIRREGTPAPLVNSVFNLGG